MQLGEGVLGGLDTKECDLFGIIVASPGILGLTVLIPTQNCTRENPPAGDEVDEERLVENLVWQRVVNAARRVFLPATKHGGPEWKEALCLCDDEDEEGRWELQELVCPAFVVGEGVEVR